MYVCISLNLSNWLSDTNKVYGYEFNQRHLIRLKPMFVALSSQLGPHGQHINLPSLFQPNTQLSFPLPHSYSRTGKSQRSGQSFGLEINGICQLRAETSFSHMRCLVLGWGLLGGGEQDRYANVIIRLHVFKI